MDVFSGSFAYKIDHCRAFLKNIVISSSWLCKVCLSLVSLLLLHLRPVTSPIFPRVSPSHTSLVVFDPYLPCDLPRQSGGSTQIPSLTFGDNGKFS